LYLAIATLSFQMIFSWTINFLEFFNQGQTIAISRVFWFTGKLGRKDHYLFWYYVILVVVILWDSWCETFSGPVMGVA
jgi:branched-chain amino acid transport system permease protein